jgi:hypothetical protein
VQKRFYVQYYFGMAVIDRDKIIDLEEIIAARFNSDLIRAPLHLYYENEDWTISHDYSMHMIIGERNQWAK